MFGCVQVVVHTSDLQGAGTDANVYVELRGPGATSGRSFLKNATLNCFERGQSDEFEVRAGRLGVQVGPESCVVMRTDI